MVGFAGGPNRPTTPREGLNAFAPAGLLFARRHSAAVRSNEIGIVDPGSAWMFVSTVGSVKAIVTKAFGLPVICHCPAVAAAGATVVATPLGTVPKLRSRMVAIVIPVVTTTASAATKLEPP